MAWDLDPDLDTPQNAGVLAFLRRVSPSAHSDVAEALIRSAADLPEVSSYCPDLARYAFVALRLPDARIIGLAWGQSALAYRLDAAGLEQALREGASVAPELGEHWARFDPWPVAQTLDESRRRLARWCARAAGRPGD